MLNPSKVSQIECYCNSPSDKYSYECSICHKLYHQRCYGFMNNPDVIICMICKLANHDPYHQIKEFVHSKPFFVMTAGDSFEGKVLKFDIRSPHTLTQL